MVRATGAEIVLGNTYHLMLRPGAERIAALGGLHKFMNWPGPILTDSGGFQVMSLSRTAQDRREAASPSARISTARCWNCRRSARSKSRLLLGADIIMQLDECVRAAGRARAEMERAMQLSLRWAERCKRAFELAPPGHALFGIVQGGDDCELAPAKARAR